MTVYLLHFGRRLHHAGHYLGTAEVLERRLRQHLDGDGSPLLLHCLLQGISFRIVRLWPGGRNVERWLKAMKCGPDLCPVCNPRAYQRAHWRNLGRKRCGEGARPHRETCYGRAGTRA